jgi:hypothetical protein
LPAPTRCRPWPSQSRWTPAAHAMRDPHKRSHAPSGCIDKPECVALCQSNDGIVLRWNGVHGMHCMLQPKLVMSLV